MLARFGSRDHKTRESTRRSSHKDRAARIRWLSSARRAAWQGRISMCAVVVLYISSLRHDARGFMYIAVALRKFVFQIKCNFTRLCSVGCVQTVPGVFTPGITLQRTSVSSVGHSYPYPELLEILYDIHTCTRNFWKFCMPAPQYPGYGYSMFCTRSELL